MKNKTEILAFLLSLLCVCVSAVVCAGSYAKLGDMKADLEQLESSVAELEKMQEEQSMQEEINDGQEPQTESEPQTEAVTETETEPQTETESQSEVIAAEETPDDNVYTVAIDPGHQGSWVDMSDQEPLGPGSSEMKAKASTGTTGRYTGIPEYQLNLDISLALQEELEGRGYAVVMTRTDNDTAISNAERAIKAYEEGGDIYVRIHANGSEDTSASGALGMVPSPENPYVAYLAEDSYTLAECIMNAYCAETGFGNLGVQYYDNMTGINWSQIPVMILEMGFMTNESDDTAMADADMRVRMVNGIANGIDAYFGR